MSRGPDNIIAEYIAAQHGHTKTPQLFAEEIEEALEAEGFMSVHRDSVLMFAPTFQLEFALSQRKDRSGLQDPAELAKYWHERLREKAVGG